MVCFSIFLPLLKGEMPEGQREFRRKALPRCAGTISRCRKAFPKSLEGPCVVAKRFRRVRKVLAPPRSVSEEFGRSSRRHEAFPKSSEGPRAIAKPFCGVREPFRDAAKSFRDAREPFRGVAETFRRIRKPALSRIRPPDIRFAVFFRKFVSVIIGFMEKRTRHDLSVMKRLEDWI